MKQVAGGIVALTLIIGVFMGFRYSDVDGNERVVVKNWNNGVLKETLGPGTQFYMPLTTDHYKYNIGVAKLIMGRQILYGDEKVDYPAYTITTGGSGKEQPATFSVTLQYRLDPRKLVELHNSSGHNYEDLVIKPALTRIISDQATTKAVLTFYSGQGRVDLQNSIEKAITDEPSLNHVGILVETFVIDKIELDENYVDEIRGRQLAFQKKLRAMEEAKAAEEVAKKEEALAEADKLKRIVRAEAEKQERVKAAEAKAAEVELAATADAISVKKAAEASRYQKEQDAKGALALGLAQAQVAKEKKMSKYEGVAGARQAAVEIEQAKSDRLKNANITGVVTEKSFMMLTDGNTINKPTPTIQINK